DQIGNRAFGERLAAQVAPAALRAVTATCLLLPQIPMLFMGEEWGCRRPFQFFCDFGAGLADRVRDGRRAEFSRFSAFQDPAARAGIPDPQAEATFLASKLDWQVLDAAQPAAWLKWYRELLAVRTRAIVPRLPAITHAADFRTLGPGAVQLAWECAEVDRDAAAGAPLTLGLAVNLAAAPAAGYEPAQGELLLWQEGEPPDARTLAPWSVRCWLGPR